MPLLAQSTNGVFRFFHANCIGSLSDANGATISYRYDAFGRTQTVTTPSGTTGYGYYGRLISVTDPDGAETRYTYDEHGNKASMISPNGPITEYGYDTLNRLISVETHTMTNDLLAAYTYTLNAKGQRTHVEEQPTGRTIEYDYDAADRLIAERISDPVLGPSHDQLSLRSGREPPDKERMYRRTAVRLHELFV
jgi:YD repeat-containing protein